MNRQVRYSRLLASALLIAPFALGSGCGDDDGDDKSNIDAGLDGSVPDGGGPDATVGPDGAVAPVGDVWAYTSTNTLLKIERATGGVERSVAAQVPAGESVWGVDVRPSNGKLYAVTSLGNVYTIDPATGAFADKQALIPDETDLELPFAALSGASYAVDFNPVADRLRIVSNTGQNLRVNVDNGKVVTDTALAPETPGITAAAYTNNWPQSAPATPCGTSLYLIDAAGARLLLQSPPNAGALSVSGTLSGVGTDIHAFDVVTTQSGANVGMLAATDGADEALYQLDLVSAKATLLSKVSNRGKIVALFGAVLTAAPANKVGELVAITRGNRVVSFERGSPGTLCTDQPITGDGFVAASDVIVGADVRASDARLYVVTRNGDGETNGKLWRLDALTGVLSAGLGLTKVEGDAYAGLTGGDYGVDFNPVADRLRVVSDTGQNLAIDAATGKVTSGTALTLLAGITPATLSVTEVAYTNPSGAAQPVSTNATTLWAVDSSEDRLGTIGKDPAGAGADGPNGGVFQSPVLLGTASLPLNGADIEAVSGLALAALSVGDSPAAAETNTQLYRINPTGTPVAVSLGKIGANGEPVRSLSFAPKP
ncbi:MAG: DUF4394 domain-containing protein [Polyangiales bacterium]